MNEDLFIKKIITLEEDMVIVKEKLKKLDLLDSIMEGQDKMVAILERLDHERVFTNRKIDELENDMKRVKLHLQMV